MTRVHRIGTITLGVTLLGFGTLFLLQYFMPQIGYDLVWKIWPVVFIILGVEVLVSTLRREEHPIVYDKVGICLVALLIMFAMGMAMVSSLFYFGMEYMM